MKSYKTGIISDQRMLEHSSRKSHPESPERLASIMHQLEVSKYLAHERVDYVSTYNRLVTDEELGWVYPQAYIEYIRTLWPKHSHRTDLTILDTYFCEQSERIARMSAGGVLEGLDRVMSGEWRNGFSLIRPPGHHSGVRNTINGFCIFNNVAVGARYLQHRFGVKKVLILDYDIHQGDGTHRIFYSDPSIVFLTVHRHDHGSYYPTGQFANYPACG
jgi:acetoin utilization deacetylase AcuC-like enzyme